MISLRRLLSGWLAILLLCTCACAAAESAYEPIISAGGSFIYARDDQGRVFCWGDNQFGQLGRGKSAQSPKKIFMFAPMNGTADAPEGIPAISVFTSKCADLDTSQIRDIVCGCDYSYFLMNDGSIYGVGNAHGQNLEIGGIRNTHVRLSWQNAEIRELATGYGHTLVLTESGEVYAWGRNHAGQVGTGNTKTPIREVHQVDLPRIVDIGCCGNHSAAVDEDGNLWMWGSNEYHQISPAKDKKITSPVKIDLGFRVREVELGGHHTAVVDEEGNLYMWGRNSSCQVGVPKGKSDWVAEPVKLDLPLPVKMIDCYGALTWVVLEDGSLWTWGLNTYGQMGVGFYTGGESGLPLSHGEREYQGKTYSSKVLDGGVRDITIGDMFGAVLTEDGTVLTCGINKFGQLGRDARYRGPENFTLTPIPIRLAGE